jgi:hypothetical protein
VAKNITKAGIRAEVEDEYTPLIIFIARDHNYLNKLFSNIQIEQTKTYLNISGFDASCYDLVAIREMPININNKILDAGLDN